MSLEFVVDRRWCASNIADGHYVDDRSLAYTISARDFIASPKASLPKDTRVSYTQCVQRVGYERDIYSIPKEELEDTASSILAQKLGIEKSVVETVVNALRLSYPYKTLKHEVYAKHFNHTKPATRSMWFWKPENKAHYGLVQSKVVRYTGTYHPACYTNTWAGDDYDPAWLEGYRQHLYIVTDECCDRLRLVYPDDVTIFEKDV